MPSQIKIKSKIPDARALVRKRHIEDIISGKITDIEIVDIYTFDASMSHSELESIASMLSNPITQESIVNKYPIQNKFDWAIEVGFLPGVTDNIGNTTRELIEDLFKTKFPPTQGVYSSQVTFISGKLSKKQIKDIADSLYNPLIQRVQIKNYDEVKDNGFGIIVPRVKLDRTPKVNLVEILNASDYELGIIGEKGIKNEDGNRNGPLALDLRYMKTIQEYFQKQGRNPNDIELESLAQSWSEHCKHTIFADPLDEITDGLFKTYIQGSTERIRKKKADKDICVSVFTDNSGAIVFDENYLITCKVETHNSPSALDPFGGAITGIVGVNRDTIGFGLGAKPIINMYGYCFADPKNKDSLYKGSNLMKKMLSSRRILEGVINGVNVGGNCSGIPTSQGFLIFDKNYRGKPLVFVGTVGLIPRKSANRLSHQKKAQIGDYIVMVGGKVGQDGIHGATFSSEIMDSKSPATAVQIGDPITQKKLSDALVKEARDLGLYNSITDNGAGGLSCSVAEMAEESNGCYVNLNKVPLKYPGLEPWKIWISESQERMTLAVPEEKWEKFSNLMKRRGVEASIIGKFTDSGKCVVDYNNKTIMDIDMNFLHNGLPKRPMRTGYSKLTHQEPIISKLEDLTDTLHSMLKRLNIANFEFISQQYDHEVQGGSVIKPLQGKGRVNGDSTVTRPLLNSNKGIILSKGINPSYSNIDTYHMAACAIDTAVRNAVATGANLDHLALLDNFCWCSSNEPKRLRQLKYAVKACYDYSVAYGTPFISGKDSMFNDFNGYNKNNKPIKISIPPTLLVSSIGIIKDSRKAVSLDAKFAGDLVYVLGESNEELGGSEYFAMIGEQQRGEKYIGNTVPKVDAKKNKKLYEALSKAIDKNLVASSQSINKGGLAIALAKTAMGGKLGLEASLTELPKDCSRDDFALFSESHGRIVVTVAPQYKKAFEKIMKGNSFAKIGTIKKDNSFVVKGKNGNKIISTTINSILRSYKATFKDY